MLKSQACQLAAGLIALTGFAAALGTSAAATAAIAPAGHNPAVRATRQVAEGCDRSLDPYTVPRSSLARCGYTSYPLERVSQLPGGGKAYTYDVAGARTITKIPPAGFDPLKATASALAANGYPPRPTAGPELRAWTRLVSGAHFVTPSPYLVAGDRAFNVVQVVGPNWAGNAAKENPGSKLYQDVYAYFYEPHIYSASCKVTEEGTWVGLGGQNGNKGLAQAGTAFGAQGIGSHQAWYEILPAKPVPIKGLYATKGQEFFAEVEHVNGGFAIFLGNTYTKKVWDGTVSASSYDGSTAEMIVEDPDTQSGVGLSNFRSFTVADAEASRDGTSYEGLGKYPHYDDVMADSVHTLAYPGSTSNSGKTWANNQSHCF